MPTIRFENVKSKINDNHRYKDGSEILFSVMIRLKFGQQNKRDLTPGKSGRCYLLPQLRTNSEVVRVSYATGSRSTLPCVKREGFDDHN
jgi:hypothetical protein